MAVLLAGCGAHAATSRSRSTRDVPAARARRTPVSVRLRYQPLYRLPAPLRDPAYSVLPGRRFVMLGGLDAADVSSATIEQAGLRGVLGAAALPAPQHDAQAATLGGRVYVFGGGGFTELDHILRYDPATQAVTQVGSLAVAQSDVAVAQAGATAYIVGGYDGVDYLNTIVSWRPGSPARVVARLPVGLRYAAVAVADGGLLIIGGITSTGDASDGIYRFDLATHAVRRLGALRHPVSHANAATLGSFVYLIGGRGDLVNAQTPDIWAINPRNGRIRGAGQLPQPTSDAAAAVIAGRIIVAGGQSPTQTLATVGQLAPAGAS